MSASQSSQSRNRPLVWAIMWAITRQLGQVLEPTSQCEACSWQASNINQTQCSNPGAVRTDHRPINDCMSTTWPLCVVCPTVLLTPWAVYDVSAGHLLLRPELLTVLSSTPAQAVAVLGDCCNAALGHLLKLVTQVRRLAD